MDSQVYERNNSYKYQVDHGDSRKYHPGNVYFQADSRNKNVAVTMPQSETCSAIRDYSGLTPENHAVQNSIVIARIPLPQSA